MLTLPSTSAQRGRECFLWPVRGHTFWLVGKTLSSSRLTHWTLANACITGVLIGRPSSVVTRVLTKKRQCPVTH